LKITSPMRRSARSDFASTISRAVLAASASARSRQGCIARVAVPVAKVQW